MDGYQTEINFHWPVLARKKRIKAMKSLLWLIVDKEMECLRRSNFKWTPSAYIRGPHKYYFNFFTSNLIILNNFGKVQQLLLAAKKLVITVCTCEIFKELFRDLCCTFFLSQFWCRNNEESFCTKQQKDKNFRHTKWSEYIQNEVEVYTLADVKTFRDLGQVYLLLYYSAKYNVP